MALDEKMTILVIFNKLEESRVANICLTVNSTIKLFPGHSGAVNFIT